MNNTTTPEDYTTDNLVHEDGRPFLSTCDVLAHAIFAGCTFTVNGRERTLPWFRARANRFPLVAQRVVIIYPNG
tara:strand:+ start:254 stop:475 length:222 start_codon:yes stop_codon:yes gene_type:complete